MSDYAVVDPATGETIQTYPTITDQALTDAAAVAQEAFRTWSQTTTVAERAATDLPGCRIAPRTNR